MTKHASQSSDGYETYQAQLSAYLIDGEESAIEVATTCFGRGNEGTGTSAADVAGMHQRALAELLEQEDGVSLSKTTVERAGFFFAAVLTRLEQSEERSPLSFPAGLAGLSGREVLVSELDGEISRCSRHGRPLSVASVRFRARGAASEQQLVESAESVATALINATRREDNVFWAGQSTFVVVMPDTPLAGATIAARRLADGLGAISDDLPAGETRARASIGTATLPTESNSRDELLDLSRARADEAQEASKTIWSHELDLALERG